MMDPMKMLGPPDPICSHCGQPGMASEQQEEAWAALRAERDALKQANSANTVALPRIDGEVQRYQLGPDGQEWVRVEDYADLNEHSAAVENALRARVAELEGKVTAIVGWLEREQPDVFRRGLWDALREVPSAGAANTEVSK